MARTTLLDTFALPSDGKIANTLSASLKDSYQAPLDKESIHACF